MGNLQEEYIPSKCLISFEEGYHEDQRRYGGEPAHDFDKDPSSICMACCLPLAVDFLAVEPQDCESENELEEADDRVDEEASEAAMGCRAVFFPSHFGDEVRRCDSVKERCVGETGM